jgi:hypothetical protein
MRGIAIILFPAVAACGSDGGLSEGATCGGGLNISEQKCAGELLCCYVLACGTDLPKTCMQPAAGECPTVRCPNGSDCFFNGGACGACTYVSSCCEPDVAFMLECQSDHQWHCVDCPYFDLGADLETPPSDGGNGCNLDLPNIACVDAAVRPDMAAVD